MYDLNIHIPAYLVSVGAACRGSIYRALGLMVAASPCALAVAPLAYAIAISSCAKKVLVTYSGVSKYTLTEYIYIFNIIY